MRVAFAVALLALGCGQRMILDGTIVGAARGADNHVTVNARLTCDTLRSYPSCVALGDYCMQARWEAAASPTPIDVVEECHVNVLNGDGASDAFVLRSNNAITASPDLRIRVTARLRNPTDAAYQIYDPTPIPCP